MRSIHAPTVIDEKASALPYYTDRWLFGFGRVDWNTLHSENRVSVQMSGADLTEARKADVSNYAVLTALLSLENITITRIDLACDFSGLDFKPLDLYKSWQEKRMITHVQRVSKVESMAGDRRAGVTVYIGSRESPRLLRVYDKAAEQNQKGFWIRLEIEFKKPLAERAARLCHTEDIAVAFWSEFDNLIPDSGVKWIEALKSREGLTPVDEIGRKETSGGEHWYMSIALAAVLEKIKRGDHMTVAAVRGALEELSHGAHGA